MESFQQWLIIFSGTTISLLGGLLYSSARQRRDKQFETGESDQAKGRATPARWERDADAALDHGQPSQVAELKKQLAEKEKIITDLQSATAFDLAMRAEVDETSRRDQRLEAEIGDLRNELQTAHQRLKETIAQQETWLKREAEWTAQMAQAKLQMEELAAENHALRAQAHTLSSQLAASENQIQELRAVQEQAQSRVRELQRDAAEYREQLETTQSALDEFKRLHQQATAQKETLEIRVGELKGELNEKNAVIARLQSEVQNLRSQSRDLQEELQRRQNQLTGTEAQMQEALRQQREALDRCARLEAEAADLTQRVEDGRSKAREVEAAQQRIAELESRERLYREQQERLEALIADMERDLAVSKNQRQALEDAHESLHEAERLCQELREENRRLKEETLQWRERLAAHEETQNEVKILQWQRHEWQRAQGQAEKEICLFGSQLEVGRESSAMPSSPASEEIEVSQGCADTVASAFTPPLTQPAPSRSADDRASPFLDAGGKQKAAQRGRALAHRHWRFAMAGGAVFVLLLAGAIAGDFFESRFSTPTKLTATPDANSDKIAAETIKVRERATPRVHGTFETIRATAVFSERSENSALVATIERGTKLNVVDSRDGWLEIRSKHGRPPGFVREEAAVRIKD